MANATTRSEKINDVLTGRVGTAAKQFLGTTGVSFLSDSLGIKWIGALAAPALLMIDQVIHRRVVRGRYRDVLTMYGPEISALSGVALPDLTIETAREILDANRSNPKFAAINEWLGINERIDRQRLGVSIIVAGLTAIGVLGMALAGAGPIVTSVVIGTAMTLINNVGNDMIAINSQEANAKSVGVVVREIAQQATMQQVQPAKLLQAHLQAKPKLKAEVEQRFQKPYDEMTLGEKNEVVQFFDVPLKLSETAEKLNRGAMRPTEMSWIVYGQRSGAPERAVAPSASGSYETNAATRTDFVSRLQQPDALEKMTGPTIH
jgi:hypothetical protein